MVVEHKLTKKTSGRSKTLQKHPQQLFLDLPGIEQIEEELQKGKIRYRELFNYISSCVAVYEAIDNGKDFIIKDFNRAAEKVEQVNKQDIIGRSVLEVFPGVKKFGLFAIFQRVWRTGKPEYHPISLYQDSRITGWKENYIYKLPDGDIVAVYDDITERKKIEQDLQESQKLYRLLADNIKDTIWLMDMKLKTTYISPSVERFRGYNLEELNAVPLKKQLTPESFRLAIKTFTSEIAKLKINKKHNISKTLELEFYRKDGAILWSENHFSLIRDEKGTPIAILGEGRDITERKELEKELTLRAQLLDHAIDSIHFNTLDGQFQYINDTMCKNLGYTRKELLGMNIKQIVAPEFINLVDSRLKRIVKKGKASFISAHCRKDGSVIPVEINARVVTYGGNQYFLSIVRDISERKQAEEKYRSLVENINDVIFSLDKEGFITYMSPVIKQVSGYSPEELVGISIREFVHPDDLSGLLASFKDTLSSRLEPYEFRIIDRNGDIVYVKTNSRPVFDNGKIIGLTGILTNLTGQKKIEAENKDFEQKAQIASRLASVGEMAAGITHEINNPLTAVIGYSQLLMHKDIPNDIKKELSIIQDGAQRVADIVKRLLMFARQQPMEKSQVNINEIIEATLKLQAYSLQMGNIKVVQQLDYELPVTMADSAQLQQVFLNLIVNAKTAIQEYRGSGTLVVKSESNNGIIRILFKDNGPGIPAVIQEKIFDPFFTTKPVGKGTGLGLSICHGIIAEHKGRIYVESEPDLGATFIIELPVVKKEDNSHSVVEHEADIATKTIKARILVIDDEPLILEYVSRLLSEAGHEVDTVDNAGNFMENIRNKRYNLFLIDIKMPGVSGIELYKQIQEVARSLARRVVFITGDIIGAETQNFLTTGNVPYISKPFDSDEFKKRINEILIHNN